MGKLSFYGVQITEKQVKNNTDKKLDKNCEINSARQKVFGAS